MRHLPGHTASGGLEARWLASSPFSSLLMWRNHRETRQGHVGHWSLGTLGPYALTPRWRGQGSVRNCGLRNKQCCEPGPAVEGCLLHHSGVPVDSGSPFLPRDQGRQGPALGSECLAGQLKLAAGTKQFQVSRTPGIISPEGAALGGGS